MEIPVSLHPPKFPLTIRDKNYIKLVGGTMLKPSELPTKERKINQLHFRNKVTKVRTTSNTRRIRRMHTPNFSPGK